MKRSFYHPLIQFVIPLLAGLIIVGLLMNPQGSLASFSGVVPYPQGAATLQILSDGEVRLEKRNQAD